MARPAPGSSRSSPVVGRAPSSRRGGDTRPARHPPAGDGPPTRCSWRCASGRPARARRLAGRTGRGGRRRGGVSIRAGRAPRAWRRTTARGAPRCGPPALDGRRGQLQGAPGAACRPGRGAPRRPGIERRGHPAARARRLALDPAHNYLRAAPSAPDCGGPVVRPRRRALCRVHAPTSRRFRTLGPPGRASGRRSATGRDEHGRAPTHRDWTPYALARPLGGGEPALAERYTLVCELYPTVTLDTALADAGESRCGFRRWHDAAIRDALAGFWARHRAPARGRRPARPRLGGAERAQRSAAATAAWQLRGNAWPGAGGLGGEAPIRGADPLARRAAAGRHSPHTWIGRSGVPAAAARPVDGRDRGGGDAPRARRLDARAAHRRRAAGPAARASPGHASAETHACVAGAGHAPHATVARRRRRAARRSARGLAGYARSLRPARRCRRHAPDRRVERRRGLAGRPAPGDQRLDARCSRAREPTFALHVHVGVPDAERAVRALRRLRAHLPLLLALAANSPYWQGRDTGLASDADPDLLDVPALGHRRGASAATADWVAAVDADGALRGDPRPELPVVGRPAAAALRHRRGAGHGRPDAPWRTPRALVALVQCARPAARRGGLRRRLGVVSARRRSPRTASSPLATGSTREFVGRLPRAATARRRASLAGVLEACRPVADALGCLAGAGVRGGAGQSPGHARQRVRAADRGARGPRRGAQRGVRPGVAQRARLS